MRMPRFRVRGLMVAVIGLCAGVAITLKSRSDAFKERARFHGWEIFGIEEEIDPSVDWQTFRYLNQPEIREPGKFQPPGVYPASDADSSETRAWRLSQRRRVDHHESMMAKYLRAARYPWLPVPPDLPEPK
jgi:hypothetical protein